MRPAPKIRIEGCVLDGDGMPINDAMIEVWQADAQGRYAHPADGRARPNTKFMGFGPLGDRQKWRLQFRHRQARVGSRPQR
jgi:protocatechuate 3,4-dioxygenase alpha subunit